MNCVGANIKCNSSTFWTLYTSPLAKVTSSITMSIIQKQYTDDAAVYRAQGCQLYTKAFRMCSCSSPLARSQRSVDEPRQDRIHFIATSPRQRTAGSVQAQSTLAASVSNWRAVFEVWELWTTIRCRSTNNICNSYNFHIRALRHIRRHISKDAAKPITCSRIDGRLDYCNSVLCRTSASNINCFQRVKTP